MENEKLYVLLSTPVGSTYGGSYRPLVIKMSFDRQELERTKAAIEAQTRFFTPKLEVCEMNDEIAEWYWPERS